MVDVQPDEATGPLLVEEVGVRPKAMRAEAPKLHLPYPLNSTMYILTVPTEPPGGSLG